jgi:hypothetical protein
MALAAIPDEINRHIEAVLALSRREVLLRILREADRCLQSEQVTAAAVLAGVALEEVCLLSGQSASDQQQETLEEWREMRDRAAHTSSADADLDKEAAKAMIDGVRALIEQAHSPQGKSTSFRLTEKALSKTRGKYAFVPTSVDEFLERKHADLDLEDRK